jgi:hypothetical protein
MGRAVVYDLARAGQPVRILDSDRTAARRVARRYGGPACSVGKADAAAPAALARALSGAGLVVNCAPYRMNLAAMDAALRAGCHYVDLGDSSTRRAASSGATTSSAAPGSWPSSAWAARPASERPPRGGRSSGRALDPCLQRRRRRHAVRVAAAPRVLAGHGPRRVHALPDGVRPGTIPRRASARARRCSASSSAPQRVHASLHSGGGDPAPSRTASAASANAPSRSTLTTRRWRAASPAPRRSRAGRCSAPVRRGVAPATRCSDCFRRLRRRPRSSTTATPWPWSSTDLDDRGPVTVRYDFTARAQRRPPLSAVARDTGFPPAIVARMVLTGAITERGVLPPERCAPACEFLSALARRGLRARRRVRRPR